MKEADGGIGPAEVEPTPLFARARATREQLSSDAKKNRAILLARAKQHGC
jgi:hypothetical protein